MIAKAAGIGDIITFDMGGTSTDVCLVNGGEPKITNDYKIAGLPLALPIVIGGVGASVADGSGRYLGFLALYDAIFALLAWASFEYVVTE